MYIGCWSDEDTDNEDRDDGDDVGEYEDCGPIDRPLDEVSDDDITAAWTVAQRIFADIPGFSEALSVATETPAPSRHRPQV